MLGFVSMLSGRRRPLLLSAGLRRLRSVPFGKSWQRSRSRQLPLSALRTLQTLLRERWLQLSAQNLLMLDQLHEVLKYLKELLLPPGHDLAAEESGHSK